MATAAACADLVPMKPQGKRAARQPAGASCGAQQRRPPAACSSGSRYVLARRDGAPDDIVERHTCWGLLRARVARGGPALIKSTRTPCCFHFRCSCATLPGATRRRRPLACARLPAGRPWWYYVVLPGCTGAGGGPGARGRSPVDFGLGGGACCVACGGARPPSLPPATPACVGGPVAPRNRTGPAPASSSSSSSGRSSRRLRGRDVPYRPARTPLPDAVGAPAPVDQQHRSAAAAAFVAVDRSYPGRGTPS